MDKGTVIWLKEVTFSYGANIVLEDVELKVKRGDFLGMIGPNGSGKTTLIRIILGLLKPDSGTVKLFGSSPANAEARAKVGFVPQKVTNFDQNFPASVSEVVAMGRIPKAGIMKQLGTKDREVIEEALDEVGMLEYRNKRIGELSGGQQQRVFMAKALAAEPELLILDEPTVGVDRHAQERFYAILEKLNGAGITIILISHDIGVVSAHVNKLACVNRTVVFHDLSKGVNRADLICAYAEGMKIIRHEHSGCSDHCQDEVE
jgi:zinc transport system ATP-binding protein